MSTSDTAGAPAPMTLEGQHGVALPPADPLAAIYEAPMRRVQITAIAICVVLNMLDGFDVLVMAFTAASVATEWSLSGAQLGLLLSAGLFGMTAGSLFVAPFGDRFGRRAVILACLLTMTLGMLASAFAQGPGQLAALRALTGLGIGGMLPSINVITAEYASRRWRSTAISVQGTGFPIGATVGGSIAAFLIVAHGWRAVFLFGGAASAAMIPAVLSALPESLDYLVSKRPPDALARLNRLLARMGHAALSALPAGNAGATLERGSFRRLFDRELRATSVLIALTFFLVMFCFYFVLSWTPKLLVEAGLSATEGVTGGVLLNLGGIAGGLGFGYLAAFRDPRRLTGSCILISAASLAAFAAFGGNLGSAFVIALLIGVVLFASMIGLYAVTPILYGAEVRSTGMGWAVGMGRFGAIASPALVGLLIDAGWRGPQLYYVFAIPLVLAAVTTHRLRQAPHC
jgi:benzoate transport